MNVFLKLIGQGFRDTALHPWAQTMALLAVTFITFLAGLMLLGVGNLDNELKVTRGEIAFQIYWKEDASKTRVETAWNSLQKMKGVVELQTFTPEEALEDLGSTFPSGSAGRLITTSNPLPYTAVLRFAHRKGDLTGWKKATEAA